jgi:SnoaL-like domain
MSGYGSAILSERAGTMEKLISKYFDRCNEADVEKTASCFCDDAVHYFPPGMHDGPFRGPKIIAEKWRSAVKTIGSYWTIDRLLVEPARHEAVLEWSHFKTRHGTVL